MKEAEDSDSSESYQKLVSWSINERYSQCRGGGGGGWVLKVQSRDLNCLDSVVRSTRLRILPSLLASHVSFGELFNLFKLTPSSVKWGISQEYVTGLLGGENVKCM